MSRFIRLFLLSALLPLAGCELVCDDPDGCRCYMDQNGDGVGDDVTGRPVLIDEGEICPLGYFYP